MSNRIKKILYFLLFLTLTALLGYLLYHLLFKKKPDEIININNVNEELVGKLPAAGINVNRPAYINVNGKLVPAANINTAPPTAISEIAQGGLTQVKQITNTPIIAPILSSDGESILGYSPNIGKFYRYNTDGTIEELTDKIFYNVEKVYWAPNTEKVILKYPDDSTIYYNFKTKKQITFSRNWKDFDFSPDSENLAFKSMSIDRENRWLTVAKEDGTNIKHLTRLGENEHVLDINWSPSKQIVGTWTDSIDLERQYLHFIGQNNESFPTSIIQGRGYRGIWSPDSEHILYSIYSSFTDLKPNLWTVTAKGEKIGLMRINLELNTWADKCVFADNYTIYCAVPRELPRGAGLVPDIAAATPDNFWKIDLRTSNSTLIAYPDGDYTAENLTLGSDNKYLYFTDKNTNTLQQIKLK